MCDRTPLHGSMMVGRIIRSGRNFMNTDGIFECTVACPFKRYFISTVQNRQQGPIGKAKNDGRHPVSVTGNVAVHTQYVTRRTFRQERQPT